MTDAVSQAEFNRYADSQNQTNDRLATAIEQLAKNQVEIQVETGKVSQFVTESRYLIRGLALAAVIAACGMVWEVAVNQQAEETINKELIEVMKTLREDKGD